MIVTMTTEKERESHVYMAKLAEQAERYDEMVESMKNVAKLDVELTVEERRMCKTQSHKFKGYCLSSTNCRNVCRTERDFQLGAVISMLPAESATAINPAFESFRIIRIINEYLWYS